MKDRVKKGLELFVFFFKIGCFTFGGGWSILAQMEQEFVDKRKWLTKSELLDMVAVGRSVPGIMITNISMIFGYSVGGVFGGFCAVLGITTPAILILSIVTMFYSKLKIMSGVQVHCAVFEVQLFQLLPVLLFLLEKRHSRRKFQWQPESLHYYYVLLRILGISSWSDLA